MNEYGQIALAVNVESCSYADGILLKAHRRLRVSLEQWKHGPIRQITLDNPHHDGPGALAAFLGANGKPLFSFPGQIVLVFSEAECDAAIDYLEDFDVLGFDTETKSFLDGSGVNSQQAAIVQLCGDEKVAYIFVIHKWPKVFESFKTLMADPSVKKVANNVQGDEKYLLARAKALDGDGRALRSSALELKGLVELSELTKEIMDDSDHESKALDEMVEVMFGEYLARRCCRR